MGDSIFIMESNGPGIKFSTLILVDIILNAGSFSKKCEGDLYPLAILSNWIESPSHCQPDQAT